MLSPIITLVHFSNVLRISIKKIVYCEKVEKGNDQEIVHSKRNSHSINRSGKNLNRH